VANRAKASFSQFPLNHEVRAVRPPRGSALCALIGRSADLPSLYLESAYLTCETSEPGVISVTPKTNDDYLQISRKGNETAMALLGDRRFSDALLQYTANRSPIPKQKTRDKAYPFPNLEP
jgi:hypothetical protein